MKKNVKRSYCNHALQILIFCSLIKRKLLSMLVKNVPIFFFTIIAKNFNCCSKMLQVKFVPHFYSAIFRFVHIQVHIKGKGQPNQEPVIEIYDTPINDSRTNGCISNHIKMLLVFHYKLCNQGCRGTPLIYVIKHNQFFLFSRT